MKKQRILALLCVLFLFSFTVSGQAPLPVSQQHSSEQHVYKLSPGDVKKMYLKKIDPDESILHTLVARYPYTTDIEKTTDLPRGNYIVVKMVGDQLTFQEHIVDDFYYKFIEDEVVRLFFHDLSGTPIPDALVRWRTKKFKYKASTKTYTLPKLSETGLIEVNNNGVYHYLEFDDMSYDSSEKEKKDKELHKGFLGFSKPKYKPGEVVKLKGYLTDNKGNPYDQTVNVRLSCVSYDFKYDTLLTCLSPYRPGMFEYQFTLSDSLNLRLDKRYNVVLDPLPDKIREIKASFEYEEYELQGIQLNVLLSQKKYGKGDSVKVRLNVTDENQMPVYDGRVDLKVIVSSSSYSTELLDFGTGFLPKILFEETIDMKGISETEYIIPDSVFPSGFSFSCDLQCTFFSPDNEKYDQREHFRYENTSYQLDYSIENGMATIRQLHFGIPVETSAVITGRNLKGKVLLKDTVQLPYSFLLSPFVGEYEVETPQITDQFSWGWEEVVPFAFYRDNDSVHLKIENYIHAPCWYTIRENKTVIASGYTSESLHFRIEAKDKSGYTMWYSFINGDRKKSTTIRSSLPYYRKNISMDVSAPAIIYPGQTVPVEITVKDKKGIPVQNADITAYAFTSKFKRTSPSIPVTEEIRKAKSFKEHRYSIYEEELSATRSSMSWARWKESMSLDTIQYYQFLHPEPVFYYSEPAFRGVTQISPYVVVDGQTEGVHLLWIDNILFYAKQAHQFDSYTFPILPGKHTIRFRTYDREVEVRNVHIQAGMRTILSIDGSKNVDIPNPVPEGEGMVQIRVKNYNKHQKGILSDEEFELLTNELISIENNFGKLRAPGFTLALPVYIKAGELLYHVNYSPVAEFDRSLRRNVDQSLLVGPFPYRGRRGGSPD